MSAHWPFDSGDVVACTDSHRDWVGQMKVRFAQRYALVFLILSVSPNENIACPTTKPVGLNLPTPSDQCS